LQPESNNHDHGFVFFEAEPYIGRRMHTLWYYQRLVRVVIFHFYPSRDGRPAGLRVAVPMLAKKLAASAFPPLLTDW